VSSEKPAGGMATGGAQGVLLFDFDSLLIAGALRGSAGFARVPGISR
jgi:hypothetical protein